jgi:hypothetical protein
MINIENCLEKFIEDNYAEFNALGRSEIIHCGLDEFDFVEVEYLKDHYRFDYKGICVYYVEEHDEIWIENMES